MRTLLSIAVLLCATLPSTKASAQCAARGLRFFPSPGSVVPLNAQLLLEGVGADQEAVAALAGEQLTLTSGDDVVPVQVARAFLSALGRSAVLLRPLRSLKPRLNYVLSLPSRLAKLELLNDEPLGRGWTAGDVADEAQPRWQEKPAVVEGRYEGAEAERSRYLRLHMTLDDESPTYLVVTLRRARGRAPVQTYFVPVLGGDALIGHQGCSGAFTFDDGRAYLATVAARDIAGNAAPELPAITLHAPRRPEAP